MTIHRFVLHPLSFILLLLAACSPAVTTPGGPVSVTLTADGRTRALTVTGLTVRDALNQAGITLGRDDRVVPAEFTRLSPGLAIQVIRVTETLIVEETVLAFERQVVRNEALPEGESRLLQVGANGVQETTFRILYEDGVQVARSIIRQQTIVEPVAEIVMIGAQASFVAVPIAGRLAYLTGGNAWVMRGTSASRRPLTISSDLDGRVFELSDDGELLLFTRAGAAADGGAFNTLWLISTRSETAQPIDLRAANILWAGWAPDPAVPAAALDSPPPAADPVGALDSTPPALDSTPLPTPAPSPAAPARSGVYTFAYTTAEPRPTAPGWQANNDLWIVEVDAAGRVLGSRRALDSSSGGVYGWWGTTFAWAPGGQALAYAQADSVGLVRVGGVITSTFQSLVTFPIYQTFSDWVWTPAVAWSPDQRVLYTVVHGPPVRFERAEDSPAFDVAAVAVGPEGGALYSAPLAPLAGMWAAPVPAPSGGHVAYLQALTPLESVSSRYYLAVRDRDGSNLRRLFPPEGEPGLTPQTVAWSPDGRALAVIRSGNLWIVDLASGESQQLTADSQASRPSWAGG